MKRRSRAGGEPIKGRRPKTPKPTRRNAPKVEIRTKPSAVAEEKEVARLARERDEALEQQTATSEVLRVISASPGELEPVFRAMLERAVRLCGAKFGNIYRWDGEALHILASHNTPPAFAEAVRRSPYRPYPNSPIGRMVALGWGNLATCRVAQHTNCFCSVRRSARYRPDPKLYLSRVLTTKKIVHITDAASDKGYLEKRNPYFVAAVELWRGTNRPASSDVEGERANRRIFLISYRSSSLHRQAIELVQNFAAQAVIAIENARLLNELRQRTAELTGRTADLTEALEQQTATSEVLQVTTVVAPLVTCSRCLQPCWRRQFESATRQRFGNVYRWDGEALHLVATHNTPPAFAEARRRSLRRRDGGNQMLTRILATKRLFTSSMLRRCLGTLTEAIFRLFKQLSLVAFARF